MINYLRASEEHIESLATLRSMVLMEVNKSTDPNEALEFERANLVYLKEAIPSGEFVAWVALDEERIVATSGIGFYRIAPCRTCPNSKAAYVQNMYTLKEYRRKGIAKELLKKVMQEAKENGCTKVMLNASSDGRPLYEKYGFTDMDNEMVFYID